MDSDRGLKRFDSRWVAFAGINIFALSCYMNSHMTSLVGIDQLKWSQIVRAIGTAASDRLAGGVPDASANSSSFQRALKSCPALAVEHAAITIRQCKQHYGPLIRGEARSMNSCKPLLENIAAQTASDASLCGRLAFGGRSRTPSSGGRIQYADAGIIH